MRLMPQKSPCEIKTPESANLLIVMNADVEIVHTHDLLPFCTAPRPMMQVELLGIIISHYTHYTAAC